MINPTSPPFVSSFPPFFGVRRKLQCGPLERIDFPALDGSGLCLHHVVDGGGEQGPVIVAPGTAMTALTYCLDSVPCNLVEFLVGRGFDIWLFDWRTSPLLAAHEQPYTMDDVARYDWPAAVELVRRRTGHEQVSVIAHCLSSPCFMLSLLRGYLPKQDVGVFVASQAGLHLDTTWVGTVKIQLHLDKLLPGSDMIHQKPSKLSGQISDVAIAILARVLPKTYSCDCEACHRHSATFGDIILHQRVNQSTHAMMGELVPECLTAFLKDVAIWNRNRSVLKKSDLAHLDRLKLPIFFISGRQNRMFVPGGTERTYKMLCEKNGPANYQRNEYEKFGHLDCFIGSEASTAIWPDIATALGGDVGSTRRL